MSFVRRTLIALLVLALLAGAGTVAIGVRGRHVLAPGGAVPAFRAPAAADRERGEHLAWIACASCHAPLGTTALSGGESNAIDARAGSVFAPNLTPAGVLRDYSDAELARAVRLGLGRDGRRLLGMPAPGEAAWSDRDLGALIAFLRAQPAVEHAVPRRHLALTTLLLAGARLFVPPVAPGEPPPADLPGEGMTREHGLALGRMLGCGTCHGERLRGGRRGPLVPQPGGDLAAFASRQTLQAFDDAMRRGVGPDGTVRDRSRMPYASYRRLTDGEVGALYTYLQSLDRARD